MSWAERGKLTYVARILVALLIALLVAGCGNSSSSSTSTTPATPKAEGDFVGIYSDDTFFGDAAYRRATLSQQHDAGVQLIRQPWAWADWARDPKRFDDVVGAAADAGIRLLPVLVGPDPGTGSPSGGLPPPADPARFAGWAALLVQRYGPAGSFWKGRADKLPITSWQVWNEPNIKAWWAPGPDPASYASLLNRTGASIHKVDPRAEIVAAGLPTSHLGMPGPQFLSAAIKAGAKFDTAAVHPYAPTPDAVVKRVQAIQRIAGDGKKVWVTEVGWGTGGKPGPLTVTPDKQAEYLKQTLTRLRQLGVRGVVVFQWRDPKPFPGRREIWPYYAGLVDVNGKPKPALSALRSG